MPTYPGAITPNRSTTLTLDRDETVVIEPGVSIMRTGSDVAKRSADKTSNSNERVNVRPWASGAWSLEPLQSNLANVFETNAGLAAIVRAIDWTFVQTLRAAGLGDMFGDAAREAQSAAAGAIYSANVPVSGDHFLRRTVNASDPNGFDPIPLNPGFDPLGPPVIPYENADVPMDRIGFTTAPFPANQGFCVRWKSPTTATSHPRYLFSFYFGQYAVVVSGDGTMWLWEYCYNAAGTLLRWKERATFDYAAQGVSQGTAHSLIIFPHMSPEGIPYIEFSDVRKAQGSQVNTLQSIGNTNSSSGEHVYHADPTVRQGDIDASPGNATASAQIRLDMRRDLKIDVQVSTLVYPSEGILFDDDTISGGGCWTSNPNTPLLSMSVVSPGGGYTVSGTIIDPNGGGTFQPGNTAQPFVNAAVFLAAVFTFASSDGANTPVLWGYSIKQEPLIDVASPGAFDLNGQSYSIEFSSGETSSESATVHVADQAGDFPVLQNRGRFSALLWTPIDDAGTIVKLFQGVCIKPRSTRIGAGRSVPGYLHPAFPATDLSIYGMWNRLNDGDHYLHNQGPRAYGIDPNQLPDTIPWKVTDIIFDCLAQCGFTAGQIAIPDLPYRIWPAQGDKTEDLTISAASSVPDYLVRIVRNYLGAHLHFEPNAGYDGAWILVFGTQPTSPVGFGSTMQFAPVYNFVDTPPGTSYQPSSFPANTSFIKSGIQTWVNPPEFNCVWVTTGVPTLDAHNQLQCAAVAVNPLSFNVPGMSVRPDPGHPDYLGRCKPIRLSLSELTVMGPDNGATFAAVQYTCRRIFDFLCHGQKIYSFPAPLGVIFDAAIGAWRPLRFQDPISIDGDNSFLIKSISAAWSSDGVQMATYEVIRPISGQWFAGRDLEHEEREQFRRASLRTSGFNSYSLAYGLKGGSAHKEGGLFELPFVRGGFAPIQDTNGQFFSIPGWMASTGAAG